MATAFYDNEHPLNWVVTPSLWNAKSMKDIFNWTSVWHTHTKIFKNLIWEKEENVGCRFSFSSWNVDLSRPSNYWYPINELWTQTFGAPNGVDKLTCPSITFKQHVQRLWEFLLFWSTWIFQLSTGHFIILFDWSYVILLRNSTGNNLEMR